VAPPLTHVPGVGEPMLGPPVPAPRDALYRAVSMTVTRVGTPEQQAALQRLAPPDVREKVLEGQVLRLKVQASVAEIMDALGPERVGAMIAAREDLALRYGEAAVWKDAAARVAR
jgi:hypothetical protein